MDPVLFVPCFFVILALFFFQFDLADLKPYDAKLMVPVNESPVSLKLEGSHVGRGNKW